MIPFREREPAREILSLPSAPSPDEVRRAAGRLRSLALRWGWHTLAGACRALERAGAAEGPGLLAAVHGLVQKVDPPLPVVAHLGLHPLHPIPGIPILRVETGKELFDLLQREPVGLFVLEVILPEEDGRTVLERLREHPLLGDLPTLAVQYVGNAALPDLLMLGVGDVLTEPVDPAELVDAIRLRHPATAVVLPEVRPGRPPALLNRPEFRAVVGAQPGEDLLLGCFSLDRFTTLLEERGTRWMMELLEEVARRAAPLLEGLHAALWETGAFHALLPGPLDAARERLDGVRRTLSSEVMGVVPGFSGAVVPLRSDGGLEGAIREARQCIFEVRRNGGGRVVASEGAQAPPAGAAPFGAGGSTEAIRARGPGTALELLLVDDDPITAAIVRHRFEREGFRVRHIENGRDAMAHLDRHPPDILVLDWNLPGADGLVILEGLRGSSGTVHLPVIMLTGRAREADLARAFAAGADDYMVKPFSPVELLARCRRLLSWRDRATRRSP